MTERLGLFPEIEPYDYFYFPVGSGHELYVEQVGNPQGQPVVFLHGGPGGGISENHRRLFDPAHYRIILFDQRGSGKSTPHASLVDNTTGHIIADMEALRRHLGIDRWLVFGGSWGSTLALAYAQAHPPRVSGLILRGIFLCRPEEIRWFYQDGADRIWPERWAEYLLPVAPEDRHDMVSAYYKLLTHDDESIRLNAAKAWSKWEGAACKLIPNQSVIDAFEGDDHALAMARIECHYFVNHIFLTPEQDLLLNADKLSQIPTWIVHGRYDTVCPVKNAVDLSHVVPHAHLEIIADAGHAYDEPGILDALIRFTEAAKLR